MTRPMLTNIAIVNSLSHDGRGIAQIQGKVTFIQGALPGEEVVFEYTKRKSRFDEAKVIEVIKPSPIRVTPHCAHFNICGGCSLQHMATSTQQELKQKAIIELLKHVGKVTPAQILPPISGDDYHYRRKARLGVRYVEKKQKYIIGFREKKGRYLTDIDHCPILHSSVGEKITDLIALMGGLTAGRFIPQIEVAIGDDTSALVFRHLISFSEKDLEILKNFGNKYGFYIYLQPKGLESIHLLWPEKDDFHLKYHLSQHQLTFLFHPTDFIQINKKMNEAMVERVLELMKPQPSETLLDLFCGLGNFTLPLARYCKRIVGIEGSSVMVERAKENAEFNAIGEAEFYCANLTEKFYNETWAKRPFDAVLLDPPRSGALEIVEWLSSWKPKRIVYISCNPATFARDAGVLVENGYRLQVIQMLDMFPQTSHTESIALFVRTVEPMNA